MEESKIKSNIHKGEELEELISQFTEEGMIVKTDRNKLDYLYNAKAILKTRIVSFPQHDETRIDCIIREMNNYTNISYHDYNKLILFLATSSNNSLLMEEVNQIVSHISCMFKDDTECLWGMTTDEKLEDKLLVMVVCSNYTYL
jgi:cell division GTPase FtsZ